MAKPKSSLFLHWGPGGNCEIERKWFGDSLPVEWWDQPTFKQDDVGAWTHLLDAATAELERLSIEAGPISLLGHSFGGQLALELSHRMPNAIRDITLLNASEWPARAFVSLASRMVSQNLGGEDLARTLETARARLSLETLWPLLGEITAVPDFMKLYWGPRSAANREKYFALSDPSRIIDLPSFSAVLNSHFVAPRPRRTSPFRGSVRLLTGEHDPLLDSAAAEAWKAHFPEISSKTVPTGHFTHFEADPRTFIERAQS